MESIVGALQARGFFEAMTGEEVREHTANPVKVYCGFDPTAESLHLGNLIPILALRWFQQFGHTPVAVIGGATAMIGDPSGKSHERPLLDEETIARNCAGIRQTLESILDFDHPTAKPVIVNNYDWFQNFGYLEFLRDVGKHFRMGTMLAKDSVRSRLQSPEGISYTEFSYQVLQAYDFLHLHDNYGVTMQIGGSDQWGNITAGTEIVRKLRGTSVHGLTLPLLLKADGSKFGKTADGALWLRKDKVSPYDFYQYLVRSADEDVGKFLRMLTFLPVEKIEALEESMSQPDCVPNQVQKVLAQEVTRIVHGQAAVDEAERVTAQAAPGRSDTELDRATLEALSQSLPSVQLEAARFQGMGLLDLMLEAGLVQSKGDARRLIRNGGCYINNQSIQDERLQLGSEQLIDGELMLVAAGKKRKAVVRVS